MNGPDELSRKVESALREYGYQTNTGPGPAKLEVAVTMFLADAVRLATRDNLALILSRAARNAEKQVSEQS